MINLLSIYTLTTFCRSVSNQLDPLIKFQRFLSFESKKVLVNSYFYSNLNYSALVWMFSSTKYLNKMRALQKRKLCYLYDDYKLPHDRLLAKSDKVNMKASKLRSLCVEILKSINSVNLFFMNGIFRLRVTIKAVRSQYRLNLDIPKVNQVSLGNKSGGYFAPNILNSLPPHIKSCENFETFKRAIKN